MSRELTPEEIREAKQRKHCLCGGKGICSWCVSAMVLHPERCFCCACLHEATTR